MVSYIYFKASINELLLVRGLTQNVMLNSFSIATQLMTGVFQSLFLLTDDLAPPSGRLMCLLKHVERAPQWLFVNKYVHAFSSEKLAH